MVTTGTMRVAQRMAKLDRAFGNAARAGEAHEFRAHGLQHLRARTSRMISVSWKKPSVSTGMISDFRPDSVRRPVVHQPSLTVSPRPNEGSQRSSTAKMKIRPDTDQEGGQRNADQARAT